MHFSGYIVVLTQLVILRCRIIIIIKVGRVICLVHWPFPEGEWIFQVADYRLALW